MINKIFLKQKLHEKSILENKILKAIKKNNYFAVHVLRYNLMLVEKEIEELQNE